MRLRILSRILTALIAVICIWAGTIAFVQRTRTIEGTWVDLFEGSSFFESQTLSQACSPNFSKAPWFSFYPKEDTPTGRLVNANRGSGQFISENGPKPVAAYTVTFVGRRKVSELLGLAPFLGIGYGHMGMDGSEFEVDRIVSIKPIADVYCDVR